MTASLTKGQRLKSVSSFLLNVSISVSFAFSESVDSFESDDVKTFVAIVIDSYFKSFQFMI